MNLQVQSAVEFVRGYRYTPVEAAAHAAAFEAEYAKLTGDEYIEAPAAVKPARISRSIADVLSTPTTVRWLKRDEIERGVIAIMAGPRGSYKSTLALNWIGHVAVELQKPVLWMTAEGSGTDRRFAAWLQKFAPDVDPACIPLRVVERRWDLNDRTKVGALAHLCGEIAAIREEFKEPPALIVIDTYSKYSGTLDENSNTDVKAFVGGLDKVRLGCGATLLLVAHTGLSDSTRARGASALAADTESEYIVSHANGVIQMTRERFKDSPSLPPLAFKPEVIELGYRDGEGAPVTGVIAEQVEATEAVLRNVAPLRENQKLVLAAVHELSPHGEQVEISAVIDLAESRKATDSKARKCDLRRYLRDALVSDALAAQVRISGAMVSRGGAVALADADWLQ